MCLKGQELKTRVNGINIVHLKQLQTTVHFGQEYLFILNWSEKKITSECVQLVKWVRQVNVRNKYWVRRNISYGSTMQQIPGPFSVRLGLRPDAPSPFQHFCILSWLEKRARVIMATSRYCVILKLSSSLTPLENVRCRFIFKKHIHFQNSLMKE